MVPGDSIFRHFSQNENFKMSDDELFRIRACFFQYVITDPFPEITQAQIFHQRQPEISAHKAWKMGFDFARQLVEKRLTEISMEQSLESLAGHCPRQNEFDPAESQASALKSEPNRPASAFSHRIFSVLHGYWKSKSEPR